VCEGVMKRREGGKLIRFFEIFTNIFDKKRKNVYIIFNKNERDDLT
jgi:hypothetical protein